MNRKVMVIGASEKTSRYANKAVRMLLQYGYQIIAIGNKLGSIENVDILKEKPHVENVHTVTMYIGMLHQKEYYDYLTKILKPERIIFNPGTENAELEKLASEAGIEVIHHCTLVMLRTGEF
jgi:uncharacterized protein